jgi:hypothetical protein
MLGRGMERPPGWGPAGCTPPPTSGLRPPGRICFLTGGSGAGRRLEKPGQAGTRAVAPWRAPDLRQRCGWPRPGHQGCTQPRRAVLHDWGPCGLRLRRRTVVGEVRVGTGRPYAPFPAPGYPSAAQSDLDSSTRACRWH